MRVWASKKKLATTHSSKITLVEDPALQKLEQDTPVVDEEKKVNVAKIKTIQNIDKFLKCLECNKKIIQGSLSNIVKCDKCNTMMRSNECIKSLTVRIVVLTNDGAEIGISIVEPILSEFLNKNVIDIEEDDLALYLFSLQDIVITYETESLHCTKIEQN